MDIEKHVFFFFLKKKKLHYQIVHPFVSLPKPWFTVGKYPETQMMEVEIVIFET